MQTQRTLQAWLLLAALLGAACGGPVGTTGPLDDVVVVVGQDLGLGPVDRVVPGMSVGVWRADVIGGVVTISERHLTGDEAGSGHRIVLDLAAAQPTVLQVVATRDDADSGTTDQGANPGTLLLQDADPSGIVSGEYAPTAGPSFRFWVDTATGTYVEEPGLGDAFSLRPGGVADSFLFATQYVGVVEDSRCPEDAQCVWEGRVVVRLRSISESGVEEFELAGLQTDGGVVFGDSPTHPAPTGSATRELALIDLEGDVATFVWQSTE